MDKVICENRPKVSYLSDCIKYEENNAIVDPTMLVNEILKLNILRIPDKSQHAVDILNIIACRCYNNLHDDVLAEPHNIVTYEAPINKVI
jgi:hypothetical protein